MSELISIATLIRREHEAVGAPMMKAVEHAIAAGELLIEAKRQVKHGEWQTWLMANCDIAERTVQAYMKLARAPIEKRNAVADLPLREALASIAKPKRYIFEDCGHPASCRCGVDYVLKDESGDVSARAAVMELGKLVRKTHRELAEWLLEHPQHSDAVVAEWVERDETQITELRLWGEGGFEGFPPFI